MAQADPRALEVLYDRHVRAMYGLALRILADHGEAETAVRAVLSDAWFRLETDDGAEPTASWLIAATRRRAIEQLRARSAPPEDPAVVELPTPAMADERPPLPAEAVSKLRAGLAALPVIERTAIELAGLEGMTASQIAERLELPPETVRTRIRNGLLSLRETPDGMTERIDDNCDGRAALYALGALGEAERSRFEEDLEASLDCVREVKSLLPVAHHLPQTALPIDPPPALRERVLREVAGWTPEHPEPEPATHEEPAIPPTTAPSPPAVRRKSGIGPLFWVVALLLVAVAGGGGSYVAALHRQIADLRADAQSANTRADILELEATVADLEAARRDEVIAIAIDPTVRSLTLAGQPLAPVGTGRALWTESGTMAFLAAGLPPPPEGETYQLWFVTPEAAPVPGALILPEPGGSATVTLQIPEGVTPAAMAVTIEPAGGASQPTGDVYLLSEP